ncbi:hypothetical protein PBY51_006725 [Eleginops maclovinus]|uniref:Uncharacterized protein n=1 Tax=Eleginops maclovinus TaxID=56733 RepID=A0AAN7X018_ELEMC|nr:hypothetical protein PBY51_006725 [Eleginops maclovinus]
MERRGDITLQGSNQDGMAMEGQIRSARLPAIRGLCQSKLLARDGAGCQGDTPPSSRTMALTNQPIHSCDVSSTANSDAGAL